MSQLLLQAQQIESARLPAVYERAQQAIAECDRLDECKDWSDKAAALASYARQAEDQTLEKYAMRIRARAVRRTAELLKQFDGRGGDRSGKTDRTGSSAATQREAVEAAGMSERQQVTAIRDVPKEEFDRQVEAVMPATVTKPAEIGKKTGAGRKPVSARGSAA